MRLLAFALAVVGLVGISFAALIARQQLVREPPAVEHVVGGLDETKAGSGSKRGSSPLEEKPVVKPVRPIAPAVVAVPPVEFEALERVDARRPLSDIALAKPPPVPDRVRVFRPVATAAGRLEAADYTITLTGIAPVEPEETCRRDDGGEWPCGMLARTALRNFLRGRSIECKTPAGQLKGAIVTDCLIANQDIGNWLVANGWARAVHNGPYAAEQKAAKSQRLGIHGLGPAIAQ